MTKVENNARYKTPSAKTALSKHQESVNTANRVAQTELNTYSDNQQADLDIKLAAAITQPDEDGGSHSSEIITCQWIASPEMKFSEF